jgi:hypothetical protein
MLLSLLNRHELDGYPASRASRIRCPARRLQDDVPGRTALAAALGRNQSVRFAASSGPGAIQTAGSPAATGPRTERVTAPRSNAAWARPGSTSKARRARPGCEAVRGWRSVA